MRHLTIFGVLLGVWLLSSCANPATTESTEQTTAEEPAPTPMQFEAFFEQYRSDTAFQMTHTVFPLAYSYLDYGEEDMVTVEETIEREDWGFNNFDMNEYAETGEAFLTLGDGENGSKVAEVRIMGTGVALDYVFELVDGHWKLTKYIDSSM